MLNNYALFIIIVPSNVNKENSAVQMITKTNFFVQESTIVNIYKIF